MQKFLDFETNLASQEGLCNMELVNYMLLQKILMKYTNKMIYTSLNMQNRKWSKTTHIND